MFLYTLFFNVYPFLFQTNLEGVNGPVKPGPVTIGEHKTPDDTRTSHTAQPLPLQSHHPRVRITGHRGFNDCRTKLPYRDAENHGPKLKEIGQTERKVNIS